VEYYLELLQRAAETVLSPFNAVPTLSQEFAFKWEENKIKLTQELPIQL
jgi:hypothetical protein